MQTTDDRPSAIFRFQDTVRPMTLVATVPLSAASSMASSPGLFLDRLAQNATSFPNKTAVTFLSSGPNGGKVEHALTYSELSKETTALASRLLGSGLSKGDR